MEEVKTECTKPEKHPCENEGKCGICGAPVAQCECHHFWVSNAMCKV